MKIVVSLTWKRKDWASLKKEWKEIMHNLVSSQYCCSQTALWDWENTLLLLAVKIDMTDQKKTLLEASESLIQQQKNKMIQLVQEQYQKISLIAE